jgi:hypothetical protein
MENGRGNKKLRGTVLWYIIISTFTTFSVVNIFFLLRPRYMGRAGKPAVVNVISEYDPVEMKF